MATGTPEAAPSQGARRAVVILANAFAPYSRGLRVARALAAEGYAVEIAAIHEAGLPEREMEGTITVRRYRPMTHGRPGGPLARIGALARRQLPGLTWPPARIADWWARLETELPPADLYHCCGVFSLPPALAARRRQRGHPATVIYDAVDDWFLSPTAARIPRRLRALRAKQEARRARSCDAVTAVNEVQARRLRRRWRLARAVVSVPNYPAAQPPSTFGQDLIRKQLGIPAETPIVLYQGLLASMGPLTLLEDAVQRLPDAALVFIGFGDSFKRVSSRDSQAPYAGRHFTLPAVHPDELIAWTASADVMLMRPRGRSPNDRRTTPNKLWEALAAGTPVVAVREQTTVARFVDRYRVGAVAAETTPESIAAAVQKILAQPPAERAAWRARIAADALDHWTWPRAEGAYRQLLHDIATRGPERPVGRSHVLRAPLASVLRRRPPRRDRRSRPEPKLTVPDRWLSTQDYVRRFGGRWQTVEAATTLVRQPPRQFGPVAVDLEARLEALSDLGVLEIDDGRLLGPHGYVVSREGYLLPEPSWAGLEVGEMRPIRRPVRVRDLSGTCVSLASDFAHQNYGHFLFDCLGRVDLLERSGRSLADADHIYCSAPSPHARRMLEQLGVDPARRIDAAVGEGIRAPVLLVPSFPGARRNYPRWLVEFLRRRLGVPAGPARRRLYVPRTTHRRIANVAELMPILEARGFEIFEPTGAEDPRKAFAEAEVVVGGHGAGLADLVFCRPGAAVLELLPETHVYPYYYTIADSAGLSYGYLIGQAIPDQPAAGLGQLDYRVDPLVFDEALEATVSAARAVVA